MNTVVEINRLFKENVYESPSDNFYNKDEFIIKFAVGLLFT